ncbi:MAG: DUF1294 domain-containing protein [Planctomycetota bacterium]|nr:DUF1294 domain-containing protein [Planctomycetota bacterium]
MSIPLLLVLGLYAFMSVVTFLLYGVDKRRASLGQRRIPERTLHVFELLGGVPGALVGQRVFRHKNRKWSFMAVFIAIALLHIAGWAGFVYARTSH